MSEVTLFSAESVSGFLHQPQESLNKGLVLTHGAGANCKAPLLVAIAEAFASAGFWVLRCDLPFRQRKHFGPPSPGNAANDREGLARAAEEMRRVVTGRVYLGGHSYGGRQASMLAAENENACDGLLLLSYPLHPPNKPQALRTAHLPNLHVRGLFVHGTNDPFGSLEEITSAARLIPASTEVTGIIRAGHDLARGKFDIRGLVVQPFLALMNAP